VVRKLKWEGGGIRSHGTRLRCATVLWLRLAA
jgi:hypothetical protein